MLLRDFGSVPDLVSVVTGDLGANKLNAEEDVRLVFREWNTIAPLRATTYTQRSDANQFQTSGYENRVT